IQESRRVDPGDSIPPLLEIDGVEVGLMTCYDLRFPELALHLALQGADVLVLPAAWVKGPLKEHHWATLLAARALETTCDVVAAGDCGTKNIGQSRVDHLRRLPKVCIRDALISPRSKTVRGATATLLPRSSL
ncbi:nitrilase-related carbon-nitrogen hydrolase, partial [Enterobacter cloacae]|uniref:nitrilase-related carbon-nitrogen hydrolase n=1 Tax=Enterobacter cloacae TaxID=550 RepID=UPI0023EF226D